MQHTERETVLEKRIDRADRFIKYSLIALVVVMFVMMMSILFYVINLDKRTEEISNKVTSSLEQIKDSGATNHKKTQDYVKCIALTLLVPVDEREQPDFDKCAVQQGKKDSPKTDSSTTPTTQPNSESSKQSTVPATKPKKTSQKKVQPTSEPTPENVPNPIVLEPETPKAAPIQNLLETTLDTTTNSLDTITQLLGEK